MRPAPRRRHKPGPRGASPPGARSESTHRSLFDAAAKEFAAHGFAGASVDRIAAAARLNKAMIYYHFGSKAKLYGDILRDMFSAVGARVRSVAASSVPAEDKIRQFVEAIATEAEARPHFPPIWFREIADGGKHLDDQTMREVAGIVMMLGSIVQEGVRQGVFVEVSPFLVHAGIVSPLLLFFASKSLRERIERAGLGGVSRFDRAQVVEHIQGVALGVLQGSRRTAQTKSRMK